MKSIKLNQEWKVGDQIGAGGFGRVFAAENAAGTRAVVKLVPKAPGADRELLFENLKGIQGVIPIIDSGEDEKHWILVMPRAERSLRDHLVLAGGSLSVPDATAILIDIAAALAEIDGKIVHRDLKPENILYFDGSWRLADFGISRYAEATTAPDTQKYALSPPYAAPERWRSERATSATDTYALGIIAYEMLAGSRPFPGPHFEDYREQHLHREAPAVSGGTAALRSVIAEALFKAPGSRPSAANMLARLKRSQEARSGGLAKLGEAHLGEVVRRSEKARIASQARSEAERRDDLFKSAGTLLQNLYRDLLETITDAAPSVRTGRAGRRGGETLSLGSAQLELVAISRTPPNPWEWDPPAFDVIAHASIIIRIPRDQYGYEGRSHSLWYCDAFEEGRYEWIETAFMITPLMGRDTTMRPFLLDPGTEAAKALWNGMAEFQLAWPIERIEPDAFFDRWSGWLADASQGRMRSPSTMPERPTQGAWRRK